MSEPASPSTNSARSWPTRPAAPVSPAVPESEKHVINSDHSPGPTSLSGRTEHAVGADVPERSGWSAQEGDQVLAHRPGYRGQGVAGDEVADAAAGFAVARRAAREIRPARERRARCLLSAGARYR